MSLFPLNGDVFRRGEPSPAAARAFDTETGRLSILQGDISVPENDDERPLYKYYQLFLKHWRLIGSVVAGAFLCGLLVSFLTPRSYTSTTSIQIDREAARVFRSQDGPGESAADPQFYATQYELLKSRALAERVVSALSLADNATFTGVDEQSLLGRVWDKLFEARSGEPEIQKKQNRAVDIFMRDVSVQPVPMSRIVKVSFTSRDPSMAQRVAGAIGENFVAMILDRRFSASAYARTFLEEKLQQAKQKLEESERQAVAYAKKEGIVDIDDKATIASQNLRALNESLAGATAERIKTAELWAQAQNSTGADLPQVLNDKLVERAREKRTELMAEYQDKLKVMKPDFPEMKQLRAQIAEFERQIKVQVDLIKGSIKKQYDAARDQEASFGRRIAEMKADVLDLRNRSIDYNILKREVDTNRSLYDGLLTQYKEVGVTSAVTTNNVSIVDKPVFPKSPSSPNLLLNLSLALSFGLIGALIAVIVREHFDDSFQTPVDVETQLGLSTLGLLPATSVTEKRLGLTGEAMRNPLSEISEAVRSLRTSLQFALPGGGPKVLLVTSAQPQEGKSTASVLLAANFAQLGQRVLLIDADLRSPSLHRIIGSENEIGLSHVLNGSHELSEAARPDVVDGVALLSAGARSPNPTDILAGQQFADLLQASKRQYDMIIIDGPPVLGLADAVLLGGFVDGALLVIESGKTPRRSVAWALKRLYVSRTPVLGVALNKFDAQVAGKQSEYGLAYGLSYGAQS